MSEKNKKIGLSAHSLNLFVECPRCFYLYIKEGFSRPRGPMPSIATGIDSLIKEYFEHFRKIGKLPPFLEGKVEGKLITNFKKTYYYDIENEKDYYLWGRLDEIIQTPNGLYVPLDHKTRASLPQGDPHDAYKLQLGIYSLLLKKENKGIEVDFGYLVYYYPEKSMIDFEADEIKNIINFNFEVKEVKIEKKFIKDVVKNAVECLKTSKIPDKGEKCEYCEWVSKTKKYYIENELNEIKEEEEEKNNAVKSEENEDLEEPEEKEFKDGKLF